jgi:hydrogenase maturation protein HypF
MLKKDLNSPVTTSMGRLFDGVASIIGLTHRVSYHAQAAIALEQSALKSGETDSYPCIVKNNMIYQFPVIDRLVGDLNAGIPKEVIARKFHNTIVEIIVTVAEAVREETGLRTVALSGGVFQNVILLENSFKNLKERGFTPLIHQLVPPNDGGISLGQAVAAHYLHSF